MAMTIATLSLCSSIDTQAQHSTYNNEVQSMIRNLKGNGSSSYGNYKKRSASIDSSVQARGSAQSRYSYQNNSVANQARNIEYRVDSSCSLCTTEIKFEKNSTALADDCSFRYLKNLATALLDSCLCSERFVIEGHASAEGSTTTNQVLSQRRANAIYDYLVRQGVPRNRLLAIGHGEAQARFPASSPEFLRARDRRVMVYKLAN